MKKITPEELTNILTLHQKWLADETGGERANLSDVDLSGSDLSNTNLAFSILNSCNLSDVDLSNTDLSFSTLNACNLINSNLNNTNLSNADLRFSIINACNLNNVNLSNTSLGFSLLNSCNLSNSDLSKADLYDAILNHTDLSNADLRNANLADADMKKVTYEQFLSFGPCWLETEEGRKKLRRYKEWWGDGKTALDILALEEVEADDKLWTVLCTEFIDEPILHEFTCRCAERALSRVDNPDPRSIAAIEAKRAWLRGEISGDELEKAEKAAWSVAQLLILSVICNTTRCVAKVATNRVAWIAAQSAAQAAAKSEVNWSAWAVAHDVSCTISTIDAVRRKERQWQVDELKRMLMVKTQNLINVKEKPPAPQTDVLLYFDENSNVVVGGRYKDEDNWYVNTGDEWHTDLDTPPTHWMPLPKPLRKK